MTVVKLYGSYSGVFPAWTLREAISADETELIFMPAGAKVDFERDGVQCGEKFYTARNVYMLASCSLRGFALGEVQSAAGCLQL